MVRASSSIGLLAFLAASRSTFAKELPVDEVRAAELYDSGYMHEELMARKMDQFARQKEAGAYNSTQYPKLGYVPCVDGIAEAIAGDANNTFRCSNADLYSFVSHAELGDELGEGSSSWGWTSEDGREFVAIGQYQGTSFAEITSEGQLVYLGRLPAYSEPSQWREIRSYKNFMIIGSEAVGHGVQIFDMTKLLDLNSTSPHEFTQDDLTGHFNALLPVGRAHNVVVNEELNYGAAVGAQPRNDSICAAGLNFFDLTDPSNPVSLGCASGDGYVHDAQCLVYRGPDTRYYGTDICFGYNEDTLTIYDVTDKNTTVIIARVSYEGASYTHQGWLLHDDSFLVLDDEYDEEEANGPAADGYPVTYVWDIRNLSSPIQTGYYKSSTKGIDHNQYVIDDYIYQSNYGAGLHVLDARSIPTDPTGAGICQAAFFDIYPENDQEEGGGSVEFVGSWSSYAFFPSGYIFINTIERGGWVVKLTSKDCPGATKPNRFRR
ncbi:hypothetical protein BDV98DRAFT_591280 [Pterulicium gracile]|uniref:Choice-of-anchor B domain-containing protein n=1 Tax=Pterulicium gracile TaxID=1884261 RepID=A0A5C3QNA6_9AGAR|nr:hypothetical protein BDV98DRAFT_591280 [Pterula gracilis]